MLLPLGTMGAGIGGFLLSANYLVSSKKDLKKNEASFEELSTKLNDPQLQEKVKAEHVKSMVQATQFTMAMLPMIKAKARLTTPPGPDYETRADEAARSKELEYIKDMGRPYTNEGIREHVESTIAEYRNLRVSFSNSIDSIKTKMTIAKISCYACVVILAIGVNMLRP